MSVHHSYTDIRRVGKCVIVNLGLATICTPVVKALERYCNELEDLDYVEIYLYETTYDKIAAMMEEAQEIGVVVVGDFITMHEAWRGWPRIHIDLEKLCKLREDVVYALILHELVHAILHGSIHHYTPPPSLLEKFDPRLVYAMSTVVKDLEVVEYLISRGYIYELKAYSMFVSKEIKDLKCIDILDLAMFMKLAMVPLVLNERLEVDESCMRCLDAVRLALDAVTKVKGDVWTKVEVLLREFLRVAYSCMDIGVRQVVDM